MNIDELFKKNLAEDEVEVSDSLWERLDSNLNATIPQNNIPQPKTTTSLLESVKSASVIAKSVAGIAGVALVGTGIYFAFDTDEQPKEQIVQTNPVVATFTPKEVIEETEQLPLDSFEQIQTSPSLQFDTIQKETENTEIIQQPAVLNQEHIIIEPDVKQPEPEVRQAKPKYIINNPKKEEIISPKEDIVVNEETEYVEKIIVEEEKTSINVKIPTVMTPNFDGINDSFEIKYIENYPDNQIVILDRRGRVLFSASNYKNDWIADGVPNGVYAYRIIIKFGSECKIYRGDITILR
jgi:gliding motility-associated-like protein